MSRELREALNIPEGGVLRILKDFYGCTTAPKNLHQNVDQSMKSLGAVKIKGDQCFWLWVEKERDSNNQQDQWRTIGFMAGHVDDFHRAGDKNNPRWNEVKGFHRQDVQMGHSQNQSISTCWNRSHHDQ